MEGLKEYLNTATHEYKCFGSVPKGPDWVEIPEGKNFAYMHSFRKYVYFVPNKLTFTSHALIWQRKPAQKKEYLVPQNAGGVMFRTAYDNGYIPKNWIEVPEGADIAVKFPDHGIRKQIAFYKILEDGCFKWLDEPDSNCQWTLNRLLNKDFLSHCRREVLWKRPTLPEALPFIDDEIAFQSPLGGFETPLASGCRAWDAPSEPPAYYGNAIRPKPRQRMYAGIGRKVINVTIRVPAPVEEIEITGTVIDCIQVPKASADYLFNTVRAVLSDDFVSKDQKECMLHHLDYLKVH